MCHHVGHLCLGVKSSLNGIYRRQHIFMASKYILNSSSHFSSVFPSLEKNRIDINAIVITVYLNDATVFVHMCTVYVALCRSYL